MSSSSLQMSLYMTKSEQAKMNRMELDMCDYFKLDPREFDENYIPIGPYISSHWGFEEGRAMENINPQWSAENVLKLRKKYGNGALVVGYRSFHDFKIGKYMTEYHRRVPMECRLGKAIFANDRFINEIGGYYGSNYVHSKHKFPAITIIHYDYATSNLTICYRVCCFDPDEAFFDYLDGERLSATVLKRKFPEYLEYFTSESIEDGPLMKWALFPHRHSREVAIQKCIDVQNLIEKIEGRKCTYSLCSNQESRDGVIEKYKMCSLCRKVFYCSRRCQKRDWKSGQNGVCKTRYLLNI